MTALFLHQDLDQGLDKQASEVALPEDPNKWPVEVQQETYKQLPFASDFDLEVVMQRADGESGTGFGHVVVRPKSQLPLGSSQDELAQRGIRIVRIPVVIRNRKLQPLDLMVTDDSTIKPLTEKRLREGTFRPSSFDTTADPQTDTSLAGQLYPPYRSNNGYGGAYKMGSARTFEGTLLDRVLPGVVKEAVDRFWKEARDFRVALVSSQHTQEPLLKVANHQYQDTFELEVFKASMLPDVLSLQSRGGQYFLKTASAASWQPMRSEISRRQALDLFDEKTVLAADQAGEVVVVPGNQEEDAGEPILELSAIQEPGMFEVETTSGQRLQGLGFPTVIGPKGQDLPSMLWWSGSEAALQGQVQGKYLGPIQLDVPKTRPSGYGVWVLNGKEPKVLGPVTVKGASRMPDGTQSYMVQWFTGEEGHVVLSPGLQVVAGTENRTLVPSGFQWLSLEGHESVDLLGSEAEKQDKLASALSGRTITLRALEGQQLRFELDGAPIAKLASDQKQFLSPGDVLFLLGGAGVTEKTAMSCMVAAVSRKAPTICKVARVIEPFEDQMASALRKVAGNQKIAAGLVQDRTALIKVAAIAPDPTSVDTLLSLNFVSPDNIQTFIGYMPLLEDTQRKLCELLLANRLGLSRLPGIALERGVRSLESVLESLKSMVFQE